jgi:Biopolymer transport protein
VDIVFLMLIFFMVSTTFKVASSLKLDLPESTSQAKVTDVKEVVVSVDAAGHFFVQDKPVADRDLRRRILDVIRGHPGMRAVLRADAAARHGRVVRVLDVFRQLGMTRVAIATVRPRE